MRDLQLEEGALLQYIDDILIGTKTKETSDQNIILTLNFLAKQGYKVSKKKKKKSPTFPTIHQIVGF